MADGITIRAENLRFDGKQFTKTMNRELEALFTEAARAFLIAAVRRIHVRTGFLRGAFSRLEDVVGTFQASAARASRPSTLRKGTGTGSRPNRDIASAGRRLARLRETQTRVLKEIKRIQRRESERRTKLNAKIGRLQTKQKGFVHEKQLAGILRANRASAIRDRARAQSLIKRAQEVQQKVDEAVRRFETKAKIKLRSVVNDERNKIRLRLQVIQQKRNEAFQRDVKRLRRKFFGGPGKTPGSRVPSTISKEEFDRRLTKLRNKISQPTRTQRRLSNTLAQQTSKIPKKLQGKLQAYARKLQQKYAQRLKDAEDDADATRDINREIAIAVARRAKRALNRRNTDPLLRVLQAQARSNARTSSESLESLRLLLNKNNEDIRNVVARTTRGRIVGQNVPGKFNLRGNERVKTIFNAQRDSSGKLVDPFLEFYYPVKGSPQSKVLKTPRSGRRFATPSNLIITKQQNKVNPNLQVFKQLAGFVQASGKSLTPYVQRTIADTGELNTLWEFHFAIDIRYLAVNEFKEGWFAWSAGIAAFNQVIASRGPVRLPKLTEFMLKETRRLTGQTRSVQINGRA